jgi:hypothetical protein
VTGTTAPTRKGERNAEPGDLVPFSAILQNVLAGTVRKNPATGIEGKNPTGSRCGDLVWEGVDLPRIPPGEYRAACVDWQGPEFVRAFQRWSVRLEFAILDDGTLVSAFYNLGSDPARPRAGRRSRYFAAWTQANGEPPRKGQKIAPETFAEPGLLYTLQVADAVKDEAQKRKPDALVYSRVVNILRVECR